MLAGRAFTPAPSRALLAAPSPARLPARTASSRAAWPFLLALPLLLACAGPGPRPVEGAALAQALQGVWCNSNDGGRSCWAYDTFHPDGRFEACGRTEADASAFHGGGPIDVQGRRMCYDVRFANAAFWLPVGSRYCTEIVAIDADRHDYRDLDTGQTFTLHRVPASARRCPA